MDWFATAFVLVGTGLIACKQSSGWVLRFLGDMLWVCYGMDTGQWSIVICEATFMVVDAWGFLNSGKGAE